MSPHIMMFKPFCIRRLVSFRGSDPCRASVRAGGTGGLPPVDLEQRVAATRPDLQPLITMRQKKSDLEEVTDEFI